jgi:SPP1 gp7 family putative phage head morphogenesis protein
MQTKTATKKAGAEIWSVFRFFRRAAIAWVTAHAPSVGVGTGTVSVPSHNSTTVAGLDRDAVVATLTISTQINAVATATRHIATTTATTVAASAVDHGTRWADIADAAVRGEQPPALPPSGSAVSATVMAPRRLPADPDLIRVAAARTSIELEGVTNEMARRVARTLVDGYKERETIDQLTKRIRDETGFAKPRARTIARTEFVRGCIDAKLDRFERRGYKKVEFSSAKEAPRHSHLTCKECRKHHGEVFAIDDIRSGKAPRIPLHPNCRCAYFPVFEFEEED